MKNMEIVDQIRMGNHKNVHRLYTYFPVVKKWLIKNGCNREETKDIYQEALLLFCVKCRQSGGEVRKQFENFARQKLGNVRSAHRGFAELSNYHRKKRQAYDKAAQETRIEIEKKYAVDDQNALERRSTKNEKENNDRVDNYLKEFEINLNDAYRQAGITSNFVNLGASYTFPVTNTGWKNLDQYVRQTTMNRVTSKTTFNGREVKLVYNKLSVRIEGEDQYDFIKCYLIPDKLNSFQRLRKSGTHYTESLNALLNYVLVCVGEIDGQSYFLIKELTKAPGTMSVALSPISKSKLKQELNNMNSETTSWSVWQDTRFEQQEFIYQNQVKERQNDREIKDQLEHVIWPCSDEGWEVEPLPTEEYPSSLPQPSE